MTQVLNPKPNCLYWTAINGKTDTRIFVGQASDGKGWLLKPPGLGQAAYYVDHLWLFQHESDILSIWITSTEDEIERQQERLAELQELRRRALLQERR